MKPLWWIYRCKSQKNKIDAICIYIWTAKCLMRAWILFLRFSQNSELVRIPGPPLAWSAKRRSIDPNLNTYVLHTQIFISLIFSRKRERKELRRSVFTRKPTSRRCGGVQQPAVNAAAVEEMLVSCGTCSGEGRTLLFPPTPPRMLETCSAVWRK